MLHVSLIFLVCVSLLEKAFADDVTLPLVTNSVVNTSMASPPVSQTLLSPKALVPSEEKPIAVNGVNIAPLLTQWEQTMLKQYSQENLVKNPEFISIKNASEKLSSGLDFLKNRLSTYLLTYQQQALKIHALKKQSDQLGFSDLNAAYSNIGQQYQSIFNDAVSSVSGMIKEISNNLPPLVNQVNALNDTVTTLWNNTVDTNVPNVESSTTTTTLTTTAAKTTAAPTSASPL